MSNNLNKEALLEKYSTSWKSLNEWGHLSPIVGLGVVTVKQVEEYCRVDHDTFQVARQRLKKQLDMLGMYTDVARHIGAVVPGAAKTESYGYLLPLEDGGVTEIPCGRYTYFTPAAVKLMTDTLSAEVQMPVEVEHSCQELEHSPGITDIVAVDGVACYEENGTVYLDLEAVSKGLGFTKKSDSGNDVVHWTRVRGYLRDLGVVQKCTTGDFIPENVFYRLAMKAKNEAAEKFQAKMADEVIPSIRRRGAYMTPEVIEKALLSPEFIIRLATELKEEQQRNRELEIKNNTLTTSNAMLAKQERTWEPQQVVNRLIRLYSSIVFGNDFKLGWSDFYHELEYRKSISLKMRNGKGSLLNRVKRDEWTDVIAVAAALCYENGIDPAKAVNQTNAKVYLEDCNAG